MPIYEYKCDACGREYEQIRRMADADRDLECPECNAREVKRRLSSFATTSSGPSAGGGMDMGGGCGKMGCGMGSGFGCGRN